MTTQITDDNAVYHADTRRIGKSGLDLIAKSPAHYYAQYLDPNRPAREEKPYFVVGSITHNAILENKFLDSKYFILDDADVCAQIGGGNPRATNRYKEWKGAIMARNEGKTQITKEEYDAVLKMRESVQNHPAASVLLQEGIAEQRIDWQREIVSEDGEFVSVLLKSKPDWLSHNGFIVDLKTTEDASPRGFAKSVWNYRYHVQAAFYLDAYEHQYGEPARGFIFIAVEKTPPYAVALYYTPANLIELGRTTYERDLRVYQRCLETREWPAYGTDVMELQLPGWAK